MNIPQSICSCLGAEYSKHSAPTFPEKGHRTYVQTTFQTTYPTLSQLRATHVASRHVAEMLKHQL